MNHRIAKPLIVLLSAAAIALCASPLVASSNAVGWGLNTAGECNIPDGSFIAIAACSARSLGLKSDGTLAQWGYSAPVPAGTFKAVSAGGYGRLLAVSTDDSLVAWGTATDVSSGTFYAVAAGPYHSLAIRTDGTLAAWGTNSYGVCDVPGGTFTVVAASTASSLGLRADGTLAIWGNVTSAPSGVFAAIAAGPDEHFLAIRADGTLAAWGDNSHGQCDVPDGTFRAVAAGYYFSLGLRTDGTLAAWGTNAHGECDVPTGAFSEVAAGWCHALAIRAVPEPSSLSILSLALASVGAWRLRRRR